MGILGQKTHANWHKTNFTVIHGSQPLLDTVANPQQVEEAIMGTDFQWMLLD